MTRKTWVITQYIQKHGLETDTVKSAANASQPNDKSNPGKFYHFIPCNLLIVHNRGRSMQLC